MLNKLHTYIHITLTTIPVFIIIKCDHTLSPNLEFQPGFAQSYYYTTFQKACYPFRLANFVHMRILKIV